MKELFNVAKQDDFSAKFVASKNATTYPDCFVCILEPLDKLAIIAHKVSEVVGVRPRLSVLPQLFPPPSQSSSCSAQPTMGLSRQAVDPELSLPRIVELTRERNSSGHQRYSSDRRDRSRSRSVNGEVASATIIAVKEQARKPSKSPWSSPLHVVPKSDSTVRPVGDYRQLNSVTEFDSYPMPYLNDFAHALHGKKIFSKIDIFKAFHQIPTAECDIPKTAVTTPWGLYEYTHLCFGLVNAPQTFMRFMHEVLRGLPFCFVYLDDILCYSENAEEHRSHKNYIQRLSSYGLKLNISKCVFGVTELIFLWPPYHSDGIKAIA
ncbi:hypothetical protein TNCV_1392671 [Trichonephila clavipes]|nr:hypothetical protein TNCV_1392671 [Trichonephila clavipes]